MRFYTRTRKLKNEVTTEGAKRVKIKNGLTCRIYGNTARSLIGRGGAGVMTQHRRSPVHRSDIFPGLVMGRR